MPSFRENAYYHPESQGLTIVAELDGGMDYEFDMVVVWRDTTNKLWAAHDAGCSCPTPFEDHTFPTDFTEVRSWDDVKPLVDCGYGFSGTAIFEFRNKVEAALS